VKNEIFDVEMLRRRFIRPYFIELGLTVGQGQPHILKELREHGAMNQKELSDACLIEVTTMSRTIDRLEKMGLVKRESNPACRRSWTIALTEEGCEMADKVIEIFEMTDGIMKSGMSEDELEILSAGLEKVKSNLWTAIRNNEENMR
jgi:DNA-binding MarR family transcriptional regulator